MSSLPNWAVGLLLILVVALIGVTQGAGPALRPAVLDVSQLASHSQEVEEGFYATPVAHTRTGEVNWARFEKVSIPMHYHGQNEVAYVLQGQFTLKSADGSSSSIGPGQLVILRAGVAHAVSGSGDILIFATPPENDRDTVYLEGPMAKHGAKAPPMVKADVIDAAQRIAPELDQKLEGFQYTVVAQTETGSVEFFRIDKGVSLHKHPKENHVLYILKGRGKGTIGSVAAEVGPGQIVIIPANVPHKLERIGDEPLDFILFSTPAFHPDDIVWVR